MPVRTCVGCRQPKPSDQLVRLTRQPDGRMTVARKGSGRGAWLCPTIECVQLARRSQGFARSLRAAVNDQVLDELLAGFPTGNEPG